MSVNESAVIATQDAPPWYRRETRSRGIVLLVFAAETRGQDLLE